MDDDSDHQTLSRKERQKQKKLKRKAKRGGGLALDVGGERAKKEKVEQVQVPSLATRKKKPATLGRQVARQEEEKVEQVQEPRQEENVEDPQPQLLHPSTSSVAKVKKVAIEPVHRLYYVFFTLILAVSSIINVVTLPRHSFRPSILLEKHYAFKGGLLTLVIGFLVVFLPRLLKRLYSLFQIIPLICTLILYGNAGMTIWPVASVPFVPPISISPETTDSFNAIAIGDSLSLFTAGELAPFINGCSIGGVTLFFVFFTITCLFPNQFASSSSAKYYMFLAAFLITNVPVISVLFFPPASLRERIADGCFYNRLVDFVVKWDRQLLDRAMSK